MKNILFNYLTSKTNVLLFKIYFYIPFIFIDLLLLIICKSSLKKIFSKIIKTINKIVNKKIIHFCMRL